MGCERKESWSKSKAGIQCRSFWRCSYVWDIQLVLFQSQSPSASEHYFWWLEGGSPSINILHSIEAFCKKVHCPSSDFTCVLFFPVHLSTVSMVEIPAGISSPAGGWPALLFFCAFFLLMVSLHTFTMSKEPSEKKPAQRVKDQRERRIPCRKREANPLVNTNF